MTSHLTKPGRVFFVLTFVYRIKGVGSGAKSPSRLAVSAKMFMDGIMSGTCFEIKQKWEEWVRVEMKLGDGSMRVHCALWFTSCLKFCLKKKWTLDPD